MMQYPISEFCDRLSILRLKCERIIGEKSCIDELNYFNAHLHEYKLLLPNIEDYISRLYLINDDIWKLEFDIRNGKEGIIGLEEVGRRAISIRDLNKKRVSIKNEIINITKIGFVDIKINHVSS